MQYDVVVIGAGIGGLTTAALLAARGVSVCVLERQSDVGGCVANFKHLGYSFEPTCGLYSGWESNGAWERIFAALPVSAPRVTKLSPNYVVRLPDGRDVTVVSDQRALEEALVTAFPGCADSAVRFLRDMTSGTTSASNAAQLLARTSQQFRWFIDAQLQMFAQCTSDKCSAARVAGTLKVATGELWSIKGGGQALADKLAESLKTSGGSLRLNSPVLRLAYSPDGTPIGVDLLSGERIIARRAIVSNLTIWDTYGKLIGPGRTPRETAIELKRLSSWGAYLMFLGIDANSIGSLPSPRTLLVYDSESHHYDPEQQQLMLNLGLAPDYNAPEGKRALTALAFTQAEEWFSFHEDHTWHEEKDRTLLESWWAKLHQALPQLGDAVEVIETNTPQTAYEATRRRLGMIGAPSEPPGPVIAITPFSNMFLVGDTVSPGTGLGGVAQSALKVADQIVAT